MDMPAFLFIRRRTPGAFRNVVNHAVAVLVRAFQIAGRFLCSLHITARLVVYMSARYAF